MIILVATASDRANTVCQVLGLNGYYRHFIESYTEHTYTPLKSLRRCCLWSEALSHEFVYLKTCLCYLTILHPSDLFVLQTDASGVGLGPILSACHKEEELPSPPGN